MHLFAGVISFQSGQSASRFGEKYSLFQVLEKGNCCNGFVSAGSLSLCYGQSIAKTVFEAQAFGAFKMKFGGVSLMSIGPPRVQNLPSGACIVLPFTLELAAWATVFSLHTFFGAH